MAEHHSNSGKSYRTRIQIMDAFIAIMRTKNLESITVKSIVEKAEITRGTFYLYFSDIYEMTNYIEDILLDEMPVFVADSSRSIVKNLPTFEECQPNSFEAAFFEYYEKYHVQLNALLGPHGDHQFSNRLKERLKSEITTSIIHDRMPDDLYRLYYVSIIPDIYLTLARESTTGQNSLDIKSLARIMATIRIGSRYTYALDIRNSLLKEFDLEKKKSSENAEEADK